MKTITIKKSYHSKQYTVLMKLFNNELDGN